MWYWFCGATCRLLLTHSHCISFSCLVDCSVSLSHTLVWDTCKPYLVVNKLLVILVVVSFFATRIATLVTRTTSTAFGQREPRWPSVDTDQWSATLLALQQTVGTCWLRRHCLSPWQQTIIAHHHCRQKWPRFTAGHTKRSPLINTITGQVRDGQQNSCNAYRNTSINLLIYFNNFIEMIVFFYWTKSVLLYIYYWQRSVGKNWNSYFSLVPPLEVLLTISIFLG